MVKSGSNLGKLIDYNCNYGKNRRSLNSKQAIKMLKASSEKVQKNVVYEKAPTFFNQ